MNTTIKHVDFNSSCVVCSRTGDRVPSPIASDNLDLKRLPGTVVRVGRDEVVAAQDEKAEYCYVVMSGCIRTVRLMPDGRRLVGEFLFPGDVFGWEALDTHYFGIEAATRATLHRFPRAELDKLEEKDPGFARKMRDISATRIRSARCHMLLLGRKTAPERIASFLLEMADRLAPDGQSRVELPMHRADMADYLGLTVETVCRQLSALRQCGAICLDSVKVMIFNRRLLEIATAEETCRDPARAA